MLQGSSSPGSYLSAGLPNIYGKIESSYNGAHIQFLGEAGVYNTGALRGINFEPTLAITDCCDKYNNPKGLEFNASLYNAIYGNSSTVQPPAYTTRFLIRAKS